MLRISKSVRSADLTAVDLPSKNQVCIDGSSVNKDCIASTETLAVITIAHGEIAVQKKHIPESHGRIHIKAPAFSVNDAVNSHLRASFTFLARSAMVTARRYLLYSGLP